MTVRTPALDDHNWDRRSHRPDASPVSSRFVQRRRCRTGRCCQSGPACSRSGLRGQALPPVGTPQQPANLNRRQELRHEVGNRKTGDPACSPVERISMANRPKPCLSHSRSIASTSRRVCCSSRTLPSPIHRITSGSALKAAMGTTSSARQRRRTNRGVSNRPSERSDPQMSLEHLLPETSDTRPKGRCRRRLKVAEHFTVGVTSTPRSGQVDAPVRTRIMADIRRSSSFATAFSCGRE